MQVNFMQKNKETGEKGEQLAVEFLKSKKFKILHTNWRNSHAEIDIIAQDGNVIVFVEVKSRKNNKFGHPETFVGKAKMKKMHEAAAAYLINSDWKGELRFDIIAIENKEKLTHFEDAFY